MLEAQRGGKVMLTGTDLDMRIGAKLRTAAVN